MAEDHLDRETAISAELTERGVKASAKSRFVAAFDRLCGNFIDLANAPIEAKTAESRALSAARVREIEALTQVGIEKMKVDPDFADRAMRTRLGTVFARQENKDAVVQQALEDLRHKPPTEQEATSGTEKLDETFLNRFERYAEDASTDELRARWGRILATEVRKPGTVSNKVLRIVDEMDSVTATLFETLCRSRIADIIPSCLVPALDVAELQKLLSADLMMDPGTFGLRRRLVSKNSTAGAEIWYGNLGDYAIAILKTATITLGSPFETDLLAEDDGAISYMAYFLTDAGKAISAILDDNQRSTIDRLEVALRAIVSPPESIIKYELRGDTYQRIT
ncbi:DUF2806 domain-containing protein [Aminobacter carboxidus]|uniref:DUF2806 domain-containing protein n=1 Tax=Aminobacter carboxidus TaxID=376165 RepID=A0ABR9GWR4_9HYPH|nr:DUF2806 domain-containing protein [Aminobacter carboxidus]MBE1208127.1 DUF2806 domain-containing protein [Aminobacter carboxidus]